VPVRAGEAEEYEVHQIGVGMHDVTRILNAIERGEPRAAEQLLPLVYDELRHLAANKLAHEIPGHTLQATALVHEAWLRLGGAEGQSWNSRNHFFKAAAEVMHRILVERARRKSALKRGGGQARIPLEDLDVATRADSETLLLVEEALERLARQDPVKAELVKLRFFIGLENKEAAEVLGQPSSERLMG
jgi:RNA polymerase sigma factor (TIGR02999 family)